MAKVKSNWQSSIKDGSYQRKKSQFRQWITADGSSGYKAESNRYHLYVSLACPWAHRTLVFRQLKGLVDHVSVSVVHPDMHENGWRFAHDETSSELYQTTGDSLYQHEFMSALYLKDAPEYQGNITVPVLWDKKTAAIVSNESADIIRMFNGEFNELTGNLLDYYPKDNREVIDKVNDWVYHDINNGVYKTGFATSQQAYEENCQKLFSALSKADDILATSRYLAGERITEADWRLWTTLVRFDSIYHTHFKCNVRLLASYQNLYNFMLELYQMQGIAETVNQAHIKRHYYVSHRAINPYAIIPFGPQQDWLQAHNRARLTR